jgi:5-carboxymethyl-2-hydroxymuconate isomerase
VPHLHLETTSDVAENQDIQDILERLVGKLATFETIAPASIKGYHSLRSTWSMGAGGPEGFVHLTVQILTGRPDELRVRIADEMFAELKACFSMSVESGEASLTMELREMDKLTYRK